MKDMHITCTKCKEFKDISEFYKNSRYSSGYCTWCNKCKKQHARSNPHIHKNWAARNKKRVEEIKRKYVEVNRDKVLQAKRRWAKANNKKVLAKTRKYQASKLNATPLWLSDSQIKEMELFYLNCPEGYEVDHIYPLQGKLVKGLHVPWNLQYLSVSENRQKSNKILEVEDKEPLR